MTKKQEKTKPHEDYAVKIMAHLQDMFDENSECEHKINLRELVDDPEKATAFVHSLANIVPTLIYQTLTGNSDIDLLGFNHQANRLIVQFTKGTVEKKT